MNEYKLTVSWGSVSAGSTVYEYTGPGATPQINIAQGRFAGQPHVAVTLEPGSPDYFVVPRSRLTSASHEGYGARD